MEYTGGTFEGPSAHATGDARAWLSDGTALPVAAATHEAVGVELPPRLSLPQRLEVSLGNAHRLVGPVQVRLGRVERRDDGSAFAVLRLGALAAERRRQYAALLMSWPLATRRALPAVEGLAARSIDDRARIEVLLRAFAMEELPALVRSAAGGPYTGARLRAGGFDGAGDLPLVWALQGPAPRAPFFVEMAPDDLLYEWPVVRARVVGDELRTALPDALLRLPADVRWLHPVPHEQGWQATPGDAASRPLARASASRVAFPLLPAERAVPGRRLELLLWNGAGGYIACRARIEQVWPSPDTPQTLCTVSFEPQTEEARERWCEALERIRNPDTRRAGTWAASLWELYDKSGYFQLSGKTTAHFSWLRRAFAVATRRLDTAPELGCQVVWPSPERIEAALSMLLVYSGTAMVYQVARRRDMRSPASARRMLRAINLHAFDHMRRDPAFEWTLVYVQEGGARWSRLAYQAFTELQLPTGLCCAVRFRAMESPPGAPRALRAPEHETGPATDDERALLVALLPRLRPAPYLEALDFVQERFDLRAVRERWAGAGFGRRREVLVARRNGRPLAAAVVESAEDALHLFGLLDCVRFFRLAADGAQALPSLVDAARAWFERQGKQTFVCFFEAENFDAASQRGLQDLGVANLLAFPRLLMPEFLEHLHVITAPRPEEH